MVWSVWASTTSPRHRLQGYGIIYQSWHSVDRLYDAPGEAIPHLYRWLTVHLEFLCAHELVSRQRRLGMDRRGPNVSTVIAAWAMAIWQGLARRNPDRGSQALSPRGILYARTWSEMARETRPSARFEPALSARFGYHRRLRVWLCLPPYCLDMTVPGSALRAGVKRRLAAVRTRPQACGAGDLE